MNTLVLNSERFSRLTAASKALIECPVYNFYERMLVDKVAYPVRIIRLILSTLVL
jgi:hypothetical protein